MRAPIYADFPGSLFTSIHDLLNTVASFCEVPCFLSWGAALGSVWSYSDVHGKLFCTFKGSLGVWWDGIVRLGDYLWLQTFDWPYNVCRPVSNCSALTAPAALPTQHARSFSWWNRTKTGERSLVKKLPFALYLPSDSTRHGPSGENQLLRKLNQVE